ncbi:hypothetical protein N7467_011089 [Penicillium canescens]|nr:hypothetical protein N7467_011089 [Penicillium canescens]
MALARELGPNLADGKIWTASGACAGIDIIAHWVIDNYDKDIAEAGFAALAYKRRDVDGNQVILTRYISK